MVIWTLTKPYIGKEKASSTNVDGLTGDLHLEEYNLTLFSPCAKLKSKWIKDLHIKPDKLNLIEENEHDSLEHISTGENFPE